MRSVAQLIAEGARVLADAGIDEPRREAASLLAFAIARDRTFLLTHDDHLPDGSQTLHYRSLVKRRAAREPFQYITGSQEFFRLDFTVAPGVLIPRPETEIIVEKTLDFLGIIAAPRICEIGVGSGCISIAILANCPNAMSVGLEISESAIAIARGNADRHGVADRFRIEQSDLFSALGAGELFDVIVSNPPYIATREIAGLQPEVRDHEPMTALTDGGDGLSLIRGIIGAAPNHLKPGGLLLIEIGLGQAAEVDRMVDRDLWTEPQFIPDLQSIPRTLSVQLR